MAKAPLFVVAAMHPDKKAAFFTALSNWFKAAREAELAKEKEQSLRRQIALEYFANAQEGVNTIPLDFGKQLKYTSVIGRTVDDAQLTGLRTVMKEQGKISVLTTIDNLFTYKPALIVKEWKAITDKERKIFADVVTEKPGMPGIAIEPIKE